MELFFIALSTVAVMLLYALPGFLLVKSKLVKSTAIADFAKLLMYVCQPMQTIYSLMQAKFSVQMTLNLIFVFVLMILLQGGMLLLFNRIFKKKRENVRYRVYTLATCMGNCAFMGVPILEALLPDYPEAVALSAAFALSMNVLGWTLGSAIISNDRKYMKVKKIFLNPAVIALTVGIPLYVTGWQPPAQINSMITLLSRMTTPLCMLIMGMRLAEASFRSLLCRPAQYAIIAIKQLIYPAAALLLLMLMPIDPNVRISVYIMICCPVASVVLNFAEMIGQGQETAANLMLLGTGLSVITIPFMVLLI